MLSEAVTVSNSPKAERVASKSEQKNLDLTIHLKRFRSFHSNFLGGFGWILLPNGTHVFTSFSSLFISENVFLPVFLGARHRFLCQFAFGNKAKFSLFTSYFILFASKSCKKQVQNMEKETLNMV